MQVKSPATTLTLTLYKNKPYATTPKTYLWHSESLFGAHPARGGFGALRGVPARGGRRVFARGYVGLWPPYALRCADYVGLWPPYAAQKAPRGALPPPMKNPHEQTENIIYLYPLVLIYHSGVSLTFKRCSVG